MKGIFSTLFRVLTLVALVATLWPASLRAQEKEWFTVVLFGDPEINMERSGNNATTANMTKWCQRIIDMGKAGGLQVAFDNAPAGFVAQANLVVCMGDMDADSKTSNSDLEGIFNKFNDNSIPFVTMLGNHDKVPDYWNGGDLGPTYGGGYPADKYAIGLSQTYRNKAKNLANGITNVTEYTQGSGNVKVTPFAFTYKGVRFFVGQTYWFQKSYQSSLFGTPKTYAPNEVIAALTNDVATYANTPSVWVQHYPLNCADRWWNDTNENGAVINPTNTPTYATADAKRQKYKELITSTKNPVHFSGHDHSEHTANYTANGKTFTDYTAPYFASAGGAYVALCNSVDGVVEVQTVNFGLDPSVANSVNSLSELSNSKAYGICTSGRGHLLHEGSNNYITVSNSVDFDATNTHHQWAILNAYGNYYLYSVGAGKFAFKNGARLDFVDTQREATPVTVTYANNKAGFPWTLRFDGKYMNCNTGVDVGYAVDNWTTLDDGNQFAFVEVGDFEIPEGKIVPLVRTSTADAPVWYQIGSYNRGGYLTANANNSLTHVDLTDNGKWWFEAVAGSDAVVLHNANGKVIASKWAMGDTPMNLYILPNGVNNSGYCISATNPISGNSCLDANNSNTGVGNWNPRTNDWQGTTWVFAETEAPAEVEPEPETTPNYTLTHVWEPAKLADGMRIVLQCRDTNGGAGYYLNGAAAKSATFSSQANVYVLEAAPTGYYLKRESDGQYLSGTSGTITQTTDKSRATAFNVTNEQATNWTTTMDGTDKTKTLRFTIVGSSNKLNSQDRGGTPSYTAGTGGYSIWYVYIYREAATLDNLTSGWYQIQYSKAGWVADAEGKKFRTVEMANTIAHNGDNYDVVTTDDESALNTLFYFDNTGVAGTNKAGAATTKYTIRLATGHKIGKGGSRTNWAAQEIGIDAPDADKTDLRLYSAQGNNYLDLFAKNGFTVLGAGSNQNMVRYKAWAAADMLAGLDTYTVVYGEGVTGSPEVTYSNTAYTGIKTVIGGGVFFLATAPSASDFTSTAADGIPTKVVVDAEAKTLTVLPSATMQDMADAAAAANEVRNLRGVGYPATTSAEYEALGNAINDVETAATPNGDLLNALQTALDAYKACTDIEKPVVGKGYRLNVISSVDNSSLGYISYAEAGIAVAADSDDAVLECVAEAGGKYVFRFAKSGKYLVAKNGKGATDADAGVNGNKGYADAYEASYAAFDITVLSGAKVTKTVPLGLVAFTSAKRNPTNNTACSLIIKNATKGFDTSTVPFFDGTFTSAFGVEDATEALEAIKAQQAEAAEAARVAANKAAAEADLDALRALQTRLYTAIADKMEYVEEEDREIVMNIMVNYEEAIADALEAVAEAGVYESPIDDWTGLENDVDRIVGYVTAAYEEANTPIVEKDDAETAGHQKNDEAGVTNLAAGQAPTRVYVYPSYAVIYNFLGVEGCDLKCVYAAEGEDGKHQVISVALATAGGIAPFDGNTAITVGSQQLTFVEGFIVPEEDGQIELQFAEGYAIYVWGEVATAIRNAKSAETAAAYNLNGQRVSRTQNGLYIVDGKKIVVK